MRRKRVDLKALLADEDLRRDLMVSTIQATQAREGIDTTEEQADRAYYVVTEADKAAFFDLERFRGGKRAESDTRQRAFERALSERVNHVRYDVARRDFAAIDTAPLAYRRIGQVSHLFREFTALDPGFGEVRQGGATANDGRYVRYWWEIGAADRRRGHHGWEPFAKGGGFSRFYSDIQLLVHWDHDRETFVDYYGRKGRSSEHPSCYEYYFRPGLTWPLRTQRGFNVRKMPAGCVFAHKGPAILPRNEAQSDYLLGLTNSALAEYTLLVHTAFGSWEVGAIKRLPIASGTKAQADTIESCTRSIYDAKSSWDKGNEISSTFSAPWLTQDRFAKGTVLQRLATLTEAESAEEARIQQLYSELNNEVYKLYGIPDATRAIIEETLGERPPEILWPQMEHRTPDQKRMEHVWRLLSYAVKSVVEADEDGIVPFMAIGGETALIDRVLDELGAFFPDQDINQVEVDITNELKRKVKGYRRVQSIREWLEDVFFQYHVSLYKKRPILWHIACSQGRGACAVGALVHYHKFDHDRLAKLRGSYLRDAAAHFRREAAIADQEKRVEDRQDWQDRLEEAESLDRRLQWVQEGINGYPADGDCRIRTPWKTDDELPNGWRPDLDDGVAVNIQPLQTAGVLRIAKVV